MTMRDAGVYELGLALEGPRAGMGIVSKKERARAGKGAYLADYHRVTLRAGARAFHVYVLDLDGDGDESREERAMRLLIGGFEPGRGMRRHGGTGWPSGPDWPSP